MTEFSQAVSATGPVVLRDGAPIGIDEIVEILSTWSDAADTVLAQEAQTKALVAKAKNLVALLDDAEVNHGGLWSGKTMRARDELRQELARWR